MDEPHQRLTVVPATPRGRPAIMPTRRATLKPCSPSRKAAEDQVLDSLGIDPGAVEEAAHDPRGEIVRPDARSSPLRAGVNGERA